MAHDYGPRYFKSPEINFKGHWAIGIEWDVQGSKENVYTVKFTEKGITCSCPGAAFRGKCKHTVAIADGFIGPDDDHST